MEYPPLVAGQHGALRGAPDAAGATSSRVDAGRARVEFTPESGGAADRSLPGPTPSRPGAFRVEERAAGAGPLSLGAGRSTRRASPIATTSASSTVFADERAARGRRREAGPADDPAAIAYLKEQQWTNPFATALVQEADVRTSIRVPGDDSPAARRRGDRRRRRRPAGSPPTTLLVDRRPRDGRAGAWPARAAARQPAPTAPRSRPSRRGAGGRRWRAGRAGARRAAAGRTRRAGSTCRGCAPRDVAVAEARLRAAEARLAQRDETLRTGGGAASGNAFALRAPIAGRLAEVMATLGAVVRRRRAALPHRPDRSRRAGGAGAGGDVAVARPTAALALEMPGVPEPIALEPASRARLGRHRSDDARAGAADGGRESRRAAARRSERHRGPVHARARSACRRCRQRGRADGSGPPLCVRADRRRAVRAPVHRDRVARRRSRRRQERRQARRARRHARRLRRAAGVGGQGLPAEGHVH